MQCLREKEKVKDEDKLPSIITDGVLCESYVALHLLLRK